MGIFSNASFNQSFKFEGYPNDPIHLDMNSNVYVEVKGRKGILSLFFSFFLPEDQEMSSRMKIS